MTHPHQAGGARGGRVLADLCRPSADVQATAGITRQCCHLQEEAGVIVQNIIMHERVEEVVEVEQW